MYKYLIAFLIVFVGSVLASIRFWGIEYKLGDKKVRHNVIKRTLIGLGVELVIFTLILIFTR